MKCLAYKAQNGESDFPNGRLVLTAESAYPTAGPGPTVLRIEQAMK